MFAGLSGTTTSYPNQRRERRFPLRYPVRIRVSMESTVKELAGMSQNISTQGLLVDLEGALPAQAEIKFSVLVPSEKVLRPIHLVGRGRIVRVEPKPFGIGCFIAVQCDHPMAEVFTSQKSRFVPV